MEPKYWMTDIFLNEAKVKFRFVEIETGRDFFRYIDEVEPEVAANLRKKDMSALGFMIALESYPLSPPAN